MAHTYILGQSMMGKTTVLYDHFLSTIHQPSLFYGEVDYLLDYIPKKRRQDVVLLNQVHWNPLSSPDVAYLLTHAIKDAWGYADLTTPDMDLYLTFTFLALAYAGKPFSDFTRFYSDTTFRHTVLEACENDIVKDHWNWYEKASERDRRAEAKSSLNKLLVLFSHPHTRELFSRTDVSMEAVLERKIVLVPLSDSHRDPLIASLFLSVLCSHLAGPFHLYLDDVHTLAPSVVIDLLAKTGKHGGSVSCAHQYIDQVKPTLYHALMGNCARKLIFKTSEDDARTLDRHIPRNQNVLSFDQLPQYTARKFPFERQDFYTRLAWSREPYPKSRSDILDNHRINL